MKYCHVLILCVSIVVVYVGQQFFRSSATVDKPQKLFVIGVVSAAENFVRRNAIRDTWAQLVNVTVGDIKFIVGTKFCSIPMADRVTPELCQRWAPRVPGETPLMTMKPGHSSRTSTGFTFLVKHSISVDKLWVYSKILTKTDDKVRVRLVDSKTGQKLVSVTFAFDASRSVLWKNFERIHLSEGFEGEIIVDNTSYEGLSPFVLDRNNVIHYFEVCNSSDLCSADVADTGVLSGFSFVVNNVTKLIQFLRAVEYRQTQRNLDVELASARLAKESSQNNDLLLLDAMDVYSTVPEKVLSFFKWATGLQYEFIVKTDDDVFLDVVRITAEFERDGDWDWWSCFKVNFTAPNSGKWRDRLSYPRVYPKFPAGSGYVLRRHLAKHLPEKPAPVGEDVTVGMAMFKLRPIELLQSQCYWSCDNSCNILPCNAPELSVNEVIAMWENYKECQGICRCPSRNTGV